MTWRSKKQGVVARSNAEAEFKSYALRICKLLLLKIILDDLRIERGRSMNLYCDNKSATKVAHNPVQQDRTKHVEIDRHFILEKLVDGRISLPYIRWS